MNEIINEVSEALRLMIEHGVEGDSTASDSQYTVRFTLIDNTKPKRYRDPIWLEDEYIKGNRTMADIASEFGITPAAINQWLVKHDIPTRGRGHREHA